MSKNYSYGLIAGLILVVSACSKAPTPVDPAPPGPPEVSAPAIVPEGEAEGMYESTATEGAALPLPEVVIAEEEAMPEDPDQLSPEDAATLDALGWQERVGDGLGIWVNVERQELTLIETGVVPWTVPCATATNGTGSISGSEMTPLGWHAVSEKFGEGAVWGQVFRSRGATHEVWQPGGNVEKDLVLTRILWLEGLEPGKNQGKNADGVMVDSKKRYIYIHGTNGEDVIGTPSSHGCVRMLNDDVIALFEFVPVGTPVLITENGAT